jgi:hypothetical protein
LKGYAEQARRKGYQQRNFIRRGKESQLVSASKAAVVQPRQVLRSTVKSLKEAVKRPQGRS